VDAFLVITLAPVMLSIFMKGRFKDDHANPINRALEGVYEPVIRWVMRWRKTTIAINLLALAISVPMLLSLGSEFMPPLDEQSILFMPVTLPDISNAEVKRILQVQDKIIKSVPEVDEVLGKAGRASTATDNSPISMIETIIKLKPNASSSTNWMLNSRFRAWSTAGRSLSSTASTCYLRASAPMWASKFTGNP
jgi:Cu(I)/Ag(I) efflux system membrane protein CusA/SilA